MREFGIWDVAVGGDEVVPNGCVEASEVLGFSDDAGALEDGVLIEAGEAFAEPGDLRGVFDDARALGFQWWKASWAMREAVSMLKVCRSARKRLKMLVKPLPPPPEAVLSYGEMTMA